MSRGSESAMLAAELQDHPFGMDDDATDGRCFEVNSATADVFDLVMY